MLTSTYAAKVVEDTQSRLLEGSGWSTRGTIRLAVVNSAGSYGWDPGPGGLGDRVKNEGRKRKSKGKGAATWKKLTCDVTCIQP